MMPFVWKSIELENIMLRKITQTPKIKSNVFFHIHNLDLKIKGIEVEGRLCSQKRGSVSGKIGSRVGDE